MRWLMIPLLAASCICGAGCASLIDTFVRGAQDHSSADVDTVYVIVDSTQVTYYWTPPTSGSTVARYEMETTFGPLLHATRAKKRITVPASSPHKVRVRGVDALDRVGPWSVWSAEWPGLSERDTINIDNPIGRDDHEIKP